MIFKQYELGCLSLFSYLIGDETTGRAVVVDPQRDVSQYIADAAGPRAADRAGHRDPLPRRLPLRSPRARRGDRCGHLLRRRSAGRLPDRRPGPRSAALARRRHPRDPPHPGPHSRVDLDRRVGARGRPGAVGSAHRRHPVHRRRRPTRPAHLDRLDRRRPRPRLYRSVHDQLLTLPDATRVLPAHGAGSACGKNLSTETESTIGEQRRTNYALAPMSEDQFVEAVTQGQSVAPLYFAFAANSNRANASCSTTRRTRRGSTSTMCCATRPTVRS